MLSEPCWESVSAKATSNTSLTTARVVLRQSWGPPPATLSSAESSIMPTPWAATPAAKSSVAPPSWPTPGRPRSSAGSAIAQMRARPPPKMPLTTAAVETSSERPRAHRGQLGQQHGAQPKGGERRDDVHRRDGGGGLTDIRGREEASRDRPVDEAKPRGQERRGHQASALRTRKPRWRWWSGTMSRRRKPCRRGDPAQPPLLASVLVCAMALAYMRSIRSTTALTVNSRARSRPAAPNARPRSGSLSTEAMARASAGASPGGTKTPVTPSTTMSTMPPEAAATTGLPAAIASSTTVGQGSDHTDGTTTARADRNNLNT